MENKNKKVKKYRTYTSEYRAECVQLALENGSIDKTSASLGISAHTLGSWVRRTKQIARKATVKNESGKSMLDLEAENKLLAQALDRSERANKVLKLAAAFFSQDQLESNMRSLKK